MTNASVNRDLAVLRNMLRLARRWKWIRQRPEFDLLPESAPRDLELAEGEQEGFLVACSPALRAVIPATLYTGMRQGELLKLTWGHIDLAARVIDFPPTKRGRKRLMPITEPLYYVLMRLKAERAASGGPKPDDRVFSRPGATCWTKWVVEAQFKTALGAAGIRKPLVFRDVRHTFASRLKRNGAHETEIQRLLGHKTLAMTDRYITVEVEQMRAAVNLLASRTDAEQAAELSRPCRNMTEQPETKSTLSGNYSE